jgi:hypothetical protein
MTGDSNDDTVVEDETVTDAARNRQSERAAHVTEMLGDEAAGLLEDRTYPTTSEELADAYAIDSVDLPNETESLGSVFDRLPDEEYASAAEAQQAAARAVADGPAVTDTERAAGLFENESTRREPDESAATDAPQMEPTFEEDELDDGNDG